MKIYSNPENLYQRFVNSYARKYPYGTQRKIVSDANNLWRNIKDDEKKVNDFINLSPSQKKNKKTGDNIVC